MGLSDPKMNCVKIHHVLVFIKKQNFNHCIHLESLPLPLLFFSTENNHSKKTWRVHKYSLSRLENLHSSFMNVKNKKIVGIRSILKKIVRDAKVRMLLKFWCFPCPLPASVRFEKKNLKRGHYGNTGCGVSKRGVQN